MSDPSSKMNVYLQGKQWKRNESNIHYVWTYVGSDINYPPIDLGIWQKEKDNMPLSAHMDRLLIDAHWC